MCACLEKLIAELWALTAFSTYEILQFRAPCQRGGHTSMGVHSLLGPPQKVWGEGTL